VPKRAELLWRTLTSDVTHHQCGMYRKGPSLDASSAGMFSLASESVYPVAHVLCTLFSQPGASVPRLTSLFAKV
jgi:hypothetical protein